VESARTGELVQILEVIRMVRRLWSTAVDSGLIGVVMLVLSILLAACNNGGKGPGY
jgi:hypothetical protein